MAKKLMINCGNCDARRVSEETLAAYESVAVNAGCVVVTPESKDLLNRRGVSLNCGNVLELEADVRLSSVNGSSQIKSTDTVPGRTYLQVNGSLEIGPGTQQVLAQYVGIQVNGSVTYPESVSSFLGNLRVNGSTVCYPDEAIVLKRNAVIDRLFALRAKEKLYWSAKRMIMVDPQLDAALLEKKGATFQTKEVIIAESKVESLIGLIGEQAEVTIVPDGTVVITDDVKLDDMTVKKQGTKLYILGDLSVPREAECALSQMEYLYVTGDAGVAAPMKALLEEKLTGLGGDMKVVKGRGIGDKMSLRITRKMLEEEADGISVSDCMTVKVDADVSRELILERLEVSDCMKVECTPEQEDALSLVCSDVMNIGSGGDTDELGIGDMIKGALGMAKEALDTKVINAGDYIL